MIERPIISVPFESIALDIVEPLPKGKGGMRYLLTGCCMATQWPDAVPLKNATATAVAEDCMTIFSWTGLPLRILTGQGAQFVSKLLKQMSELFGKKTVTTTPYRPQGNGIMAL